MLAIADHERIDVKVRGVAVFMFVNGACFAITFVGGAAHDAVHVKVHSLGIHCNSNGAISKER